MNEAKNKDINLKIHEIKNKLLARKSELEALLVQASKSDEAPDPVQDIGDHAQSLSLETLKTSLQDTEIAEYNMIKQALHLIEMGAYGICTDCEQPISEKRLMVYPNATRCIACQELLEEKRQR